MTYSIREVSDYRNSSTPEGSFADVVAARSFIEASYPNHTIVVWDEFDGAVDLLLAPANKKVGFDVQLAIEAA